MNRQPAGTFKRFLFYFSLSLVMATIGYYILWFILPHHEVFGSWYRMFRYHDDHPFQYIAIMCFFYAITATWFSNIFLKKKLLGRLILTLTIVVITVVISSPFGGILWYIHFMPNDFFNVRWISAIITKGTIDGLILGWLIIAFSIPYNLLGIVVCYFLTKKGAEKQIGTWIF